MAIKLSAHLGCVEKSGLKLRTKHSFECSWGGCLGIVNYIFGYACGEWGRGCMAEWFTGALLFSIVALRVLRDRWPKWR